MGLLPAYDWLEAMAINRILSHPGRRGPAISILNLKERFSAVDEGRSVDLDLRFASKAGESWGQRANVFLKSWHQPLCSWPPLPARNSPGQPPSPTSPPSSTAPPTTTSTCPTTASTKTSP